MRLYRCDTRFLRFQLHIVFTSPLDVYHYLPKDYGVVDKVIVRIKERLRTIPKLDILSQPFRISFVKIGNYRFAIVQHDRSPINTAMIVH